MIIMRASLDDGLLNIKKLLLKMGKLAEDSIKLALTGFSEREDTYDQVKTWSNTLLILSEEVQDKVTELIALYQPMARDIRCLRAYIKIAYDFERFGRYAYDISDISQRLGTWKPFSNGELLLDDMENKVQDIVKIAIKLIETEDESLIKKLSEIEDNIDSLYFNNLKLLIDSRKTDTKTVIAYLLLIRYLERIADHASYIGESITYAYTGERVSLR